MIEKLSEFKTAITLFIAVLACIASAYCGAKYAAMKAEAEFYEYRIDAAERLKQAMDEKQASEAYWRGQLLQLQANAGRERDEIEKRYRELLLSVSDGSGVNRSNDGNRLHNSAKSAGDGNGLPTAAGTADRTQSSQKDRQPRPSCRVYQNALSQAKKRILYEAKERDICAVHYNALLQIYNSIK